MLIKVYRIFFEVTKGCTGSLEFLGLNDRVRDGVRNRAKVQLIGDFPPPQPLTKEVKSLLTSRCQIQSRRTPPCLTNSHFNSKLHAMLSTISLESHWHCTAFQRLVLHIYMLAKALVFSVVASTLGH